MKVAAYPDGDPAVLMERALRGDGELSRFLRDHGYEDTNERGGAMIGGASAVPRRRPIVGAGVPAGGLPPIGHGTSPRPPPVDMLRLPLAQPAGQHVSQQAGQPTRVHTLHCRDAGLGATGVRQRAPGPATCGGT